MAEPLRHGGAGHAVTRRTHVPLRCPAAWHVGLPAQACLLDQHEQRHGQGGHSDPSPSGAPPSPLTPTLPSPPCTHPTRIRHPHPHCPLPRPSQGRGRPGAGNGAAAAAARGAAGGPAVCARVELPTHHRAAGDALRRGALRTDACMWLRTHRDWDRGLHAFVAGKSRSASRWPHAACVRVWWVPSPLEQLIFITAPTYGLAAPSGGDWRCRRRTAAAAATAVAL